MLTQSERETRQPPLVSLLESLAQACEEAARLAEEMADQDGAAKARDLAAHWKKMTAR